VSTTTETGIPPEITDKLSFSRSSPPNRASVYCGRPSHLDSTNCVLTVATYHIYYRCMINGTYAFVYCGNVGIGIGIFRVTDAGLVGTDYGGVNYRGTASETETGEIRVEFEMSVPADVLLVQGTSPLDFNVTRGGSFMAPPGFGDGQPFEVYVAPGNVRLMIKRVPDEYSVFVDGFEIVSRRRT
jgi:hypothetical protein